MTHLIANWPAPKNVRALTTTRFPGYSETSFAENNLALHVDDNPVHVQQNRAALIQELNLPHEPIWLDQTHSNHCVLVEHADVDRQADAAVTRHRQFPLVIMTADCLPIVLCDQQGTEIAAIHAGWRGLVGGVIENTLSTMISSPETCIAWIGPAICGRCYETGEEVFDQFKARFAADAEKAFFYQHGRLHADLAFMAELVLLKAGIPSVTLSKACTFESNDYYSYRKNAQTGRIATLIWFENK